MQKENGSYILEGELTVVTPKGEQTYRSGDACALAAETVHTEQVGPKEMKGLLGTKQPC